jgi:hypothetical protein
VSHEQQDQQDVRTSGRAWRDQAACRGTDPELFFPAGESGPVHDAQVAAAKAVCAGCPVRAACLAEALARIPYGIAGGLTEQERRRLRTRDTGHRQSTGLSAQAREVLSDGPTGGMTRRERAQVGRELLADGRPSRQVASACRVSTRTAERWATTTSAATTGTTTSTSGTADARGGRTDGAGEGSRGGNRAPLRISTAPQVLGRDTSTERSRA